MHPAAKVGIAGVLIIGASYALCGGEEVPVDDWESAPPEGDTAGPRFRNSWWDEVAPCPDGAVLRGAAPPAGRDVWCELPDGTRHGPHTAWWPNGRTHFERAYANGVVDGAWKKWRPDGRAWAAGTYRAGVRTGRWIEWGDLGEATVTDFP